MTGLTLTDFLLTRIADEEAIAREGGGISRFSAAKPLRWVAGHSNNDGIRQTDGIPVTRHSWPQEVTHITRWDPARVLSECEAKRRIIELHSPLGGTEHAVEAGFASCGEDIDIYPCETLRLLASVYADHSDYQEAWRP